MRRKECRHAYAVRRTAGAFRSTPTLDLMRRISALLAGTLVATGAICASPEVSKLQVDVDCDGKPDSVFLYQDERAASVRVVFGNTKRRPARFRFTLSPGSQGAVCKMPVRLDIESLDYDPSEEDVGELPGFSRSKTCVTFVLSDGECDSVHFYWNHNEHKLQWWRR